MLYFQFVGRSADKTNPLSAQIDQVFRRKPATHNIITGYRAIFLLWLRDAPDNERSAKFQKRLHMRLLASGSHQDEAVHSPRLIVLVRPFRVVWVYMDHQQIILPAG